MNSTKGLVFWSPALATMLCQGLGIGLIGVFGFFIEPLANEFNASVASINIAPVLLILVPGLIGPMIGKFADQFAIKNIMLSGLLIAQGSLYGIATADNIYLVCLGFLGFSIGLSLYGPITVNTLLVKVYKDNAGRALAIAAMGVSIATTLLPFAVTWLILQVEWRQTLVVLSLSITLLLGIVMLKVLPSGLIGGDPTGSDTNKVQAANKALQTSAKPSIKYLKDRTFWQIGLAVAIAFNVALVLGISYPPHFSNMGFSLSQAAFLVSVAGFSGLIGKAGVAVVADKLRDHVKYVAAVLILIEIIGVFALISTSNFQLMVLAVAALGIGGGAFIPMHPYLNSGYFSADIIGRINGAQMPLFLPFGLIAPPLTGFAFDATGSYAPAFVGLIIALVVAMLLLVCLPKVKPLALTADRAV